MGEVNQNLWAPWRMEYIRSMTEPADDEGCFLCLYRDHPDADRENHVVWRSRSAFVVMNRFPYSNGHLLVAHAGHKADLHELNEEEFADMGRVIRDAVGVLRGALKAQGFNIGYNLGHCAGAGLPGHLHAHVVPRWAGDTNFMAVVADHRVIPQSLDALYLELVDLAREAGLRT